MAFHPEKLLQLHLPHLMMITVFLFLIIPCASQISFNYTDFSQANNEAITMAGNASISGSAIQLTPNAVENWGRATYSETMHLWEKNTGIVANFTTIFSFIISSEGADRYSDGLSFFLASPDFPPPIPTDGSGIGLVSRDQMRDLSFLAANKFVTVEFDTFWNARWDPPDQLDREHVGININNITSQNSTTWYSVIKEKRTYSCSISYDSSTQNLSVSFTGFSINYDPIPIKQHLSSIVDLRDYLPKMVEFGFSAATGMLSELHILSSWSFESTAPLLIQNSPQPEPNKNEKESKAAGLVVGLSVGASACVLIVGGFGLVWVMKRKKSRGKGGGDGDLDLDFSMDDEFERSTGPEKFSYKELARATNNFARENKLGEGGFGGVYKGFLREMNFYVAIKRVSRGSKQGIKEYAYEVKSISRLRHRNLVQLIGWCHENKDLLLIYEFMLNGSLDSHLFKGKSLLTWATRYNVKRLFVFNSSTYYLGGGKSGLVRKKLSPSEYLSAPSEEMIKEKVVVKLATIPVFFSQRCMVSEYVARPQFSTAFGVGWMAEPEIEAFPAIVIASLLA
ncbi:L-type lectin-domain containing receptor kinase IX.1-like [Corylus avellana]|uniref:L-type lectin-domain containing receptor kinase IX.1-like n=1 Tax=Corylus avellana TaxID=13451 RepID=UPI00286BE135|nr:L-type lectin-domain containing receptor kinase IX.1-like [Corylus avellana]